MNSYRIKLKIFLSLSILMLTLFNCDNTIGTDSTDFTGRQDSAPKFSPDTGIYQSAQTVSITTETVGAMIKYTTDNTTPSLVTGIVYEHPITVPVSTTIRAAAFKEEMDPSTTSDAAFTIDSFTPGTQVSPVDTSLISTSDQITVTFNETMDIATLVMGGDIAAESDGGVWDSVVYPNDTLRLNPTSPDGWTIGSFRTFMIDCSDLAGNPAASVTLDYDVCVIYVRALDGDDGNDGSRDAPLRTIAAGIGRAHTLFSKAIVKVAEGSYDVDSSAGETIVLQEAVSVFGGYSESDWSIYDSSTYVSSISDTNTTDDGTIDNPLAVLDGGSGLTRDTLIKGFTIKGAGRSYTTVIANNNSSPSYINNKIKPGPSLTYGFYNKNAAPLILANKITADDSGGTLHHSIYEEGCTSEIMNNEIMVGMEVGSSSYAIYEDLGSESIIRGNTIDFGLGLSAITGGIYIKGGSVPVIENNLFTSIGGYLAIQEADISSDPASVRNNLFHNCTFYYDADKGVSISDIGSMETNLSDESITSSGNITVADPFFVDVDGPDDYYYTLEDNNLHLTTSSHKNLLQGGINGGPGGENWGIDDDLDGQPRTSSTSLNPDNSNAGGWSIGCYEKD